MQNIRVIQRGYIRVLQQQNIRVIHKKIKIMATIAELLASSLDALKQVQQGNDFTIIRSSDLSRTHIKRLVDNHFLKPIIKGWYVVTKSTRLKSVV